MRARPARAALGVDTTPAIQATLARKMAILTTVMQDVASQESSSAVIAKLIHGTYELVGAERVTLFMVDHQNHVRDGTTRAWLCHTSLTAYCCRNL